MQSKDISGFGKLTLGAGLAFLYVPILILIVYSFNASKLVTVWASFSTHWYGVLFNDDAVISAFGLSLKIALFSSAMSVVLGTIAGLVLARFGPFKGKSLFAGMLTAPMVMPEVITGLSMLLLFVEMQQWFGFPAERGMLTIWVGHVTLCMAYVTVVIRSRLVEMDRSVEEAAMDLGARPFKIFFQITLPIIAPAIASSFLLAFTLSIDDLVITAFLSGPGSTTLPQLIFSRVRLGLNPEINALATMTVLVVTLLVVGANRMMVKAERRRARLAAAA
ncbi:ABC transporter permease subunit [Pseudogulbenkiania ferrooxidans]|uniref:Ornithine carbamoyltransferase n=1 Tax=Pseudogulbenkiania ferrooxidans 2002 TaxID=279714 RepID=B9Z275_9NEIS|nr:ABC transporter permease subunit [Pseudogulbenkiania ferrooxidans]EEG09520.1 Ornithine carbamoyltransferase [Pseudogulbenkiania ferrooxidans 2002]